MAPGEHSQHGVENRGPALPTPAATVVPLRDGVSGIEVLMLRRNSRGAFGGMWVFPGGQIDAADRLDSAPPPTKAGRETGHDVGDHADIGAARRAARREAQEEASLLLDADTFVLHSLWIPPPQTPRRFATWFFLAPVGDAPEVVVDGTEIHEHRWFPPSAALEARDRGELSLAPPTWMTLWWLSHYAETVEALEASAARPPERFETRMYKVEGGLVGCWAGDVAYESGQLDPPGPRRRLWMTDPQWRAEVAPA